MSQLHRQLLAQIFAREIADSESAKTADAAHDAMTKIRDEAAHPAPVAPAPAAAPA